MCVLHIFERFCLIFKQLRGLRVGLQGVWEDVWETFMGVFWRAFYAIPGPCICIKLQRGVRFYARLKIEENEKRSKSKTTTPCQQ